MFATSDFPWEIFGAGGAAVLIAALWIASWRREDAREDRLQRANEARDKSAAEQHAKCNDTIEKCTNTFASTIDRVTARSDERYAQMMREQRSAHEELLREQREAYDEREEKLVDALRSRVGSGG